jgi:hypothetical protein
MMAWMSWYSGLIIMVMGSSGLSVLMSPAGECTFPGRPITDVGSGYPSRPMPPPRRMRGMRDPAQLKAKSGGMTTTTAAAHSANTGR